MSELQDSGGWLVRNAIVWHKPNGTPESVRDRLACRYELVFLLVKQPRCHFDLDPIRAAGGRKPGDVWSVTVRPFRGAHFAVQPVEVASRCIAAGCRPGGLLSTTADLYTSVVAELTRDALAAGAATITQHRPNSPAGTNRQDQPTPTGTNGERPG